MTPRFNRLRPGDAGMTLLEIMLVLAVMGLVMAVGVRTFKRVTKTELRKDASKIAGVLRSAYNMATQTGMHHRVVFDLEHQAYRIEACQGDIRLQRTDEEVVVDEDAREELEDKIKRAQDALAQGQLGTVGAATSDMIPEIVGASSPEAAAEAAAALAGVTLGPTRCGPPALPNGKPDPRAEPIKVRREVGVTIRRVYVQHLREPVKDAMVSINFFPLGYAEKAAIEISDQGGNQYHLLVHRLTGRTEMKGGDVDVDDFMNRDGAGDREDER